MTAALVLLVCVALGVALVVGVRVWDAAVWRRDLAVYRLRFPRGVHVEQVVHWLSSLPPAGRYLLGSAPLALEVVASEAGIEHRLSVYRPRLGDVLPQLQAALPGVRLEELEASAAEMAAISAVELRLTSRAFPLAVERAEASAAAVLAATMPLEAGEVVRVQWLIRGAPVPGVPRRRGSSTAWLDGDGTLDSETLRATRRKQAEPLLLAVGRIGVAAGDPARRAQLLARLRAA